MAPYWLSDPVSGDLLGSFERLRRGLDEALGRFAVPGGERSRVFPPVNLYETEQGYVLTAELPGLSAQDVEISVEGDRLTLSGERRIGHPEGAGKHRIERPTGRFRRVVQLPEDLEPEKAEAVCKHGVLLVRIPKAPERQPRRIAVKTK